MTELLEKAIAQLANLPNEEQDAIALIILEEIADDIKWDQAFANSQDLLAKLGAEAMEEYHAGQTVELELYDQLLSRFYK
jgi:hypothetical protein